MNDEDYIDTDALLRLAIEQASRPRPDGSSDWMDAVGSIQATVWFEVLARPYLYQSMERKPTREHLVNMVDVYLRGVRRKAQHVPSTFYPVPREQREPSALRLRALLEAWTPPELTEEITAAVREVLHAEGNTPAEGWDQMPLPEPPVEQQLCWPEDVPEPLRTPPPPEPRR